MLQKKDNYNRLAQIDFYNQHCSGRTDFMQAKLSNINVSNRNLNKLDLRKAQLDNSNLENTTLSNCNLSKSSLINTNWKKASINDVNFNFADLTKSKLSCTEITNVSFFGACLNQALFGGAKLDGVNFGFTNLSAAYLAGIDLNNSVWTGAIYNCNTAFPVGFSPVDAGMIHQSNAFDLKKISAQFQRIYQGAKKYLGDKMATKYMDFTRPKSDRLDKLEIDCSSRIVFQGNAIKSLDYIEAEYLREWMIAFIHSFLKVVDGVEDIQKLFPNLLD